MASSNDQSRPDVLEEGEVFFAYLPRVEEQDPSALSDIQQFAMVLRPDGGDKSRLLVLGRKRLPGTPSHERHWGFVDRVADDAADIEKDMRGADYETKARGEQRQPAARPAGEGVYALSLEDGQMRLSYALELPEEPDKAQKALKIAPEASYALSIKNPEKGQPKGAGLREGDKADYPEKLQEEFRGRRFAREDARLLDYEGAEFVLVGARKDLEAAYDIDLGTEHETYESAEIMRQLRMKKSRHPVKPLFEGRWA